MHDMHTQCAYGKGLLWNLVCLSLSLSETRCSLLRPASASIALTTKFPWISYIVVYRALIALRYRSFVVCVACSTKAGEGRRRCTGTDQRHRWVTKGL
jgi:hypothetical protein